MSDDIVERLRERSGKYDSHDWHSDIELEAADEIERLRAELDSIRTTDDGWKQLADEIVALRAEIERLRVEIQSALIDLEEFGEPWTGKAVGAARQKLRAALNKDKTNG